MHVCGGAQGSISGQGPERIGSDCCKLAASGSTGRVKLSKSTLKALETEREILPEVRAS